MVKVKAIDGRGQNSNRFVDAIVMSLALDFHA